MRKPILPLLLALSITFFAQAQPPCAFDQRHQQLLNNDPAYAQRIEANNQSIKEYIARHPQGTGRINSIVTIPVVVHVMNTGGAIGTIYNPSDAQIIAAINYLNQVYAGTYSGMIAPIEGGGVVDMQIQFGLAQRTPSCGATNGIDRVDASGIANYTTNGVNVNNTTGCSELSIKNLSRWNTADYYNIWVVNKLDGKDGTSGQFIAGFAYFPGASSLLDGTIMLATQMIVGQNTLPHEIGHALNLYHTFEGSANNTQCPSNADCTAQGDRVCDTDPIYNNYSTLTSLYDFTCRSSSSANTCASPNNYSVNTERNFMSYTSCHDLFTNGQRTRAQAALSLSSRASLVAGTNQALVPCGTTINFATASATQAEDPAGTVSGCRRYHDYTYQMTIGAGPSQAATATLSFSGTAVKGLDYDVTTNNDFVSMSNVVSFASGSTTSQPIYVRIYDDASVEATKTIILDFTVNAGTGNANKGTTTPTFTFSITDNDVAPVATSSGTYSIGTIDGSTISETPFDATKQSQRVQFLYKTSELIAAGLTAGNISSMQLNIQNKFSTRAFSGFTIKLGNTTTQYLVDGSVTVISGMTTVYSGTVTTATGWNTFNFSTPFTWNGTGSIAVEICFSNATADPANGMDDVAVYADGGISSQGNLFWQDNINCAGSFTSVNYYGFGYKPVVRFNEAITGTAVENSAGATSSGYIANGSSDYFYSNNGKLLMRLNNVSATLGCVSTSLDAAGSTWVSALGGARSAKVFAVTPTTNTATTTYAISLYFENAELGGKDPSTLRIAKTTASSAALANSGNTVLVTPVVTTLGSGITIMTGNFTGFSRFFLVDPNVTLPVSLLNFTATVTTQQHTLLQWATASEHDNLRYDIEVSNDGVNFTFLSSVNSHGNSTITKQYDYTHLHPAIGMSWYRLKQVDLDGHFTYSHIVTATITDPRSKPYVFPVPAHETVTVNFGKMLSGVVIELYTSDMKFISREKITTSSFKKELPVSQLPAGVYFLKINSDVVNETLRFIKQ